MRLQTLQRALELALELESFRLANRQQRTRVSWGTKLQDEVKPQDVTTTTLDIAKKMEAASDQIARSMETLEALMRGRCKLNQKSPQRKDSHDTKCWKCGEEGRFRYKRGDRGEKQIEREELYKKSKEASSEEPSGDGGIRLK